MTFEKVSENFGRFKIIRKLLEGTDRWMLFRFIKGFPLDKRLQLLCTSFSMGTLTKSVKVSGSELCTFIDFQYWGLKSNMNITGLKSSCRWGYVPSGCSGESISLPFFFKLPEAAHIPWWWPLSLIFTVSAVVFLWPCFHHLSLPILFCLLPPVLRTFVVILGEPN